MIPCQCKDPDCHSVNHAPYPNTHCLANANMTLYHRGVANQPAGEFCGICADVRMRSGNYSIHPNTPGLAQTEMQSGLAA